MKFFVLICLFIAVNTREVLYSKIQLPNPVTMEYSDSMHDISAIVCGQKCTSTPGCERFHYDSRSCYILNNTGIATLDVRTFFGTKIWTGNCNNTEYPLYGGRFCMKIFQVQQSWSEANTTCLQNGGQLLTMKSDDFGLKKMVLEDELVSDFTNGRYWIAGNDFDTQGEWKWNDGSTIEIGTDRWYPNQPDNHLDAEHCVEALQLQFNDRECNTSQKFICEKLNL